MARSVLILLLTAAFILIAFKDITVKVKAENQTAIKYSTITPKDAKRRLELEKGIILLDVRTPEEYREMHIPGSTLIPLDTLEKTVQDKIREKKVVIFVYCKSGRRSTAAAEILVKYGYANVFNLGGILDWPYETE